MTWYREQVSSYNILWSFHTWLVRTCMCRFPKPIESRLADSSILHLICSVAVDRNFWNTWSQRPLSDEVYSSNRRYELPPRSSPYWRLFNVTCCPMSYWYETVYYIKILETHQVWISKIPPSSYGWSGDGK